MRKILNDINTRQCLPYKPVQSAIVPSKTGSVEDCPGGEILDIKRLVHRAVQDELAALYSFNPLLMQRRFVTPKEAAELLKISYYTILEYVKAGRILAAKIGNDYRIENSDLERFIEQSKKYNHLKKVS